MESKDSNDVEGSEQQRIVRKHSGMTASCADAKHVNYALSSDRMPPSRHCEFLAEREHLLVCCRHWDRF